MSTALVAIPESPEAVVSGSEPGIDISQVPPHSLNFTHEAITFSHQIMSAMYWDLNSIWQLQRVVADDPSDKDLEQYRTQCGAIRAFWDHVVDQSNARWFQREEHPNFNRCRAFVFEHGWAFFAMCTQAQAFRDAYFHVETFIWDELRKLITAHKRSIEVFVRTRNIDWRGPLLLHARWNFQGILEATDPMLDIGKEHTHHIVQNLEQTLKRPIYQGMAQTNINSTIDYRPLQQGQKQPLERFQKLGPCMACLCKKACACHKLGGSPDCKKCNCPKLCRCRKPEWVRCCLCGSREICQCRIQSVPGDLIELREYPSKGTGIRALSSFKAGTILGVYLGEAYREHGKVQDDVYALEQLGFQGMSGFANRDIVAIVTSARLGNWTRFINHHCESNCIFRAVMVGGRATTIVEAIRDISMFEEITINYGPGYWRRRHCLCGSDRCFNPPKTLRHRAI